MRMCMTGWHVALVPGRCVFTSLAVLALVAGCAGSHTTSASPRFLQMAPGMTVPSHPTSSPRDSTGGAAIEPDLLAFLHAIYPGALTPESIGTTTPAGIKVAPDVAVKMLENVSKGEAAFKPEFGKAGCSWFISEGSPHAGVAPGKNIEIPVEIAKPPKLLQFTSDDLVKLRDEQQARIDRLSLEAKYRTHLNIPPDQPLNSRARKGLERLAKQLAETRMWDEVGRRVRASAAKVGEVILKSSEFSKSADGKFLVVADSSKIQVKGGVTVIIQALENGGFKAEPVLVQAAEQMAQRLKWAGRVKTAFRYGGAFSSSSPSPLTPTRSTKPRTG